MLCFLYTFSNYNYLMIQGGSNMTGTDLYVNKPHCAAAVRPWESEATTSTLPPARLEPVQSCLGVARVVSEQKVPRSVEQRIVIKFLIGENVPSAEIHHRLQQQYGEECLWFHLPSNIWWGLQIMRLVLMQLPLVSCNCLSHSPKYVPQYPVFVHPQLMFFP